MVSGHLLLVTADVLNSCRHLNTNHNSNIDYHIVQIVAPEHPLLDALSSTAQTAAVRQYADAASRKSDLERTELQKDKSGVFTGASNGLLYFVSKYDGQLLSRGSLVGYR